MYCTWSTLRCRRHLELVLALNVTAALSAPAQASRKSRVDVKQIDAALAVLHPQIGHYPPRVVSELER